MKVIELLNKIANGEEPPKKIVFRDEIYEYDKLDGDYRNKNYDALFDYHEITDILNDEVEILETTITYNQDKKIEKIKDLDFNTRTPQPANENEAFLMTCINWLAYKQGELIDRINNE